MHLPLATETRWSFAHFGLVVGEHKGDVLPTRILTQRISFLVVELVSVCDALVLSIGSLRLFPHVEHWKTQIVRTVRKGAVRSIFDAVATIVGVIDAHAGLVVAKMVTALGVPSSAVQVRATETREIGMDLKECAIICRWWCDAS